MPVSLRIDFNSAYHAKELFSRDRLGQGEAVDNLTPLPSWVAGRGG